MARNPIEVANISDTGQKRPHNEDSAVTDTSLGLAVVADGMGGYKAGEVASAIAAQLIHDTVGSSSKALQNGEIDEATGLTKASLGRVTK